MTELEDFVEEFGDLDFGGDFVRAWNPTRAKTAQVEDDEYKLQDILSSGIYLLCHDDRVIYVGKARVLIRRIYQHYNAMERRKKGLKQHKGQKGFIFTKVRIFLCSVEELASLERKLIARFRPVHNERLVPKLLGKLTLAQVGFRFDRLGIVEQKPEPHRPIPSAPFKRRF